MSWQRTNHEMPLGYTLWHDPEHGYWRVVRAGYTPRNVVRGEQVEHPITKKMALESWESGRRLISLRKTPPRTGPLEKNLPRAERKRRAEQAAAMRDWRERKKRGLEHKKKLTDRQVNEILSSDESNTELAKRYGINPSYAWYIRNKKRRVAAAN